jgi:hypothetical protein
VPYEARQPSIFIEMVPIHTKRLLWEMGERTILIMPFCLCRKAFCFSKIIECFTLNSQNLYLSDEKRSEFLEL